MTETKRRVAMIGHHSSGLLGTQLAAAAASGLVEMVDVDYAETERRIMAYYDESTDFGPEAFELFAKTKNSTHRWSMFDYYGGQPRVVGRVRATNRDLPNPKKRKNKAQRAARRKNRR